MAEGIEFTSRYDVFGPPNGCKGQCEGTGFIPHDEYLTPPGPSEAVPVEDPDDPPIYRVLWFLLEARSPNEPGDRWHLIPCPDCRQDDPLIQLARRFMGIRG